MTIKADRLDSILCTSCGAEIDLSGREPFTSIDCPQCGTSQLVAMKFGSVYLMEPLGSGGMGAVYRAYDPMLKRYVAIKVMQETRAGDEKYVEEFLGEARAAASLNHVNMVQIYSCGEEKGQPYMVMELLEGGTLDDVIRHSGAMNEIRVLEIGIDVAEGLKAANEISLVHGDIKPANILFENHNIAKVTDFGLARFMQQGSSDEIWGTPFYIAPEKLRKEKEDQRSDIYSLGATLFHALTGQPPFDAKTASEVALARLKQPPPDVREMVPDISPEVAQIISRTLKTEPHDRYPTYVSLLADMRHALQLLRKRAKVRQPKPRMKKSHAGVFVALLLAGVLGFIIWMNIRPSDDLFPASRSGSDPAPAIQPSVDVEDDATPFKGVRGTAMERILKLFAAGKTMAAAESLETFYRKLPSDSADCSWIRICQALLSWYEGTGQSTAIYTDQILNTIPPDKSLDELAATPELVFAKYINGDISDQDLEAAVSKNPEWVRDLGRFVIGLNHARRNELELAEASWQAYMQVERSLPSWVYCLKPVAGKFIGSYTRWQVLSGEIDQHLEAREPEAARNMLREFGLAAGPVFSVVVAGKNEKIQAVEASLTEEETARIAVLRAEEEQRQKEKVNIEVSRIKKVKEENRKHLPPKKFHKALAALEKLGPSMSMEESWALYQVEREKYRRMSNMHKYLFVALRNRPYKKRALGTGGRITGVSSRGVKIALSKQATMTREWKEISAAQYIEMLRYYLDQDKKADGEKAHDYLSLAIIADVFGGSQAAQRLAVKAVAYDADIKDLTLKLLPESKLD